MHIRRNTSTSHSIVNEETLFGSWAFREADHHGVPIEGRRCWDLIEQLDCTMHNIVGNIEGEDAAGDVGEIGEAEGDNVGMDLVQIFQVGAFLNEGEVWVRYLFWFRREIMYAGDGEGPSHSLAIAAKLIHLHSLIIELSFLCFKGGRCI